MSTIVSADEFAARVFRDACGHGGSPQQIALLVKARDDAVRASARQEAIRVVAERLFGPLVDRVLVFEVADQEVNR